MVQMVCSVIKPILSILSYHWFHVSGENPGTIFFKQYSDSEESSFYAFEYGFTPLELNNLPEEIVPAGLDLKRQWYLYEQIRHSALFADLSCPKPSLPKPSISDPRSHDHEPADSSEANTFMWTVSAARRHKETCPGSLN